MLLVKRMIGGSFAVVLACAALSAPLTYAQTSPPSAAEAREKPRQGGAQTTPAQRASRDAKRPYAKRGGETPRPQRMSPEERRQLRRDIKDAGSQIYTPRRPPVKDPESSSE